MKYIKLYEEFTYEEDLLEPEVELQPEVSDKTIDDVLEPEFFEETEEKEVTQDKRGVYHISNWYIY
jgi:hypothetical protein